MSEPTVATPATPPKKPGKKFLGLPLPVAIGAAAALVALGYIWWRDKHKSAASASTSTSSAAEIGALEQELAELQGQGSSSALSGAGSGGGSGGGVGLSTSTATPAPASSSSTSTATGTKLAKNPVSNLHITDTGYTSLTGSWDKSANATSYLITVLKGGTVLKTQHAAGTTARVGNLKRGTAYEYRVRAQPGGVGGSDAHVDVTTKK